MGSGSGMPIWSAMCGRFRVGKGFLNDVALLDGHDRSSRGECSILPEDDMQGGVADLLALTVPPTNKAKNPRADLRG